MLKFKDYTNCIVETINGDSVLITGLYVKEKLRPSVWNFSCKECGKPATSTIARIKNGKCLCNDCSHEASNKKRMLTNEQYLQKLKSIGSFAIPIDYYNGADTPIKHICPVCKRTDWMVSPSNLYKGLVMCNNCNLLVRNSVFAEIVQQFFEFKNFGIREYDIGYKSNSLFDIYIPTLNKLIEIQSEFHDSDKRQKQDYQKRKYAEDHGYIVEYIDNRFISPFDYIKRYFPNVTMSEIMNVIDLSKLINRSIVCLNVDGTLNKQYDGGISQVAIQTDYSTASISRACNGNNTNSKHFAHGLLWYWLDEYDENQVQVVTQDQLHQYYIKNKKYIYIAQKDNIIIKRKTAKELAEAIGAHSSLIHKCISGERHTTNGYSIKREIDIE